MRRTFSEASIRAALADVEAAREQMANEDGGPASPRSRLQSASERLRAALRLSELENEVER